MLNPRLFTPLACLAMCCSLSAATVPSFDKDVQPILQAKCVMCHGATPQGKLDLRTEAAVLKGGASGLAVEPGASDKSLIITKVVTRQMPPGNLKLTDKEIDAIRQWIDQGLAVTAPVVVTEHEVRAIFQARCVLCHGSTDRKGGLDMRTLESRLKGGKSGPGLVPGKPDESLIYQRIVKGQMPPDKLAKELAVELPTASETEKIRAWIAAGAPGATPIVLPPDATVKEADRQFWSFQPPKRPAVPTVKNQALVRNPIDSFLLQKLEAKGMKYTREADRLALMRRAYLDVTGVPPTPAEIDSYTKDTSPTAYEKMIDRLLASPRYGERWGQHWLDLAGYSDSEGFGQDDGVRPSAFRYRDYVIRSLNADKPYNRFLTEQLAGDEMSDDWKKANGSVPPETVDRLAATGFLRTVPDPTDSNERGLIAERMNVLADEVEVLTSSVLGLTVGCARCHNHKYDPIPQRDYYRLSAILQGAYDPYEWKGPKKRELDLGTEAERKEVAEKNAPVQAEIKALQQQVRDAAAPFRAQALEAALAAAPAEVRDALRAAAALTADKRDEAQRALAEKYKDAFLTDQELGRKYPELRTKMPAIQKELGAARGKLLPVPHVRVLADNTEPSQAYLLQRGDPVNYGDPVEPGVPGVLLNAALKPYAPVSPFAGTSGRRLALADWLTQPEHPLTARVAVNQLWLRHFGRGIVPSVSNFGRSGVAPTHPELLDWLATEFVAQGWSMKAMHRLMLTSQAYRQASRVDEPTLTADPENALLSRMPLQRMDAETLYDSLIAVAGRLDSKLYGPAAEVDVRPDKEVVVKPGADGFRRSIYVLHRRQTPVSLLDAFDQPAMTPNCTERRRSNVATQALHMMNGSMTWDLARYMAGRVIDEAGADTSKQIELIYLRTYARRPTADEVGLGQKAIADFRKEWPARLAKDNAEAPREANSYWLALANYCHALMNSAEFSFID
ncbi:MAG: PSD1 and planctomycete cytochrome C domain-containing protein [Candidatus Solibacter sp.]